MFLRREKIKIVSDRMKYNHINKNIIRYRITPLKIKRV